MLAHATVNGAALTAGDLFGTGTISGPEPGTEGCLLERFRGERWLRDGDEVVISAPGLGEVRGRVAPPADALAAHLGGAHPEHLHDVGRAPERVGDDGRVRHRDGGDGAAVDLGDEDAAGERLGGVDRRELREGVGVVVRGDADGEALVGGGGEHGAKPRARRPRVIGVTPGSTLRATEGAAAADPRRHARCVRTTITTGATTDPAVSSQKCSSTSFS